MRLRPSTVVGVLAVAVAVFVHSSAFVGSQGAKCSPRGDPDAIVSSLNRLLTSERGCGEVDLSWRSIGGQRLNQLDAAFRASGTSLSELELKGNLLGNDGAAAVADWGVVMPYLRELDLTSNDIGDAGAVSLASSLPTFAVLQDLDLGANSISSAGASALIRAAKQTTELIELDLAFNLVDDDVVDAVEDLFSLPVAHGIRKLKLSGNLLSQAAVGRLMDIAMEASSSGRFVKISVKSQRLNTFKKMGVDTKPSASVVGETGSPAAGTPGGLKGRPSSPPSSSPPTRPGRVPPPSSSSSSSSSSFLPLADWSDTDVAQWLDTIPALSQYKETFLENAIDGSLLSDLGDGDLEELGVQNSFHRKRLLKDVQKLSAKSA